MLTVKKHLWMKFFMLTLSTTLLIGTAKAESLPVKLLRAEVAVQLKEDENMTGEIHHLRLSCFEGECEINTTIFNRCIDLSGEKSQRIFSFVEKSTDPNSTFKIDGNMIDVSILSRDFGGKTITTYQFELGKKKIGGYEVANFSGGYMKDSDITKNLIKMEFIPLIGQYHKINLDCPIEVPGIVKTKNK